jgi:beta-lactamase regulating signal transducer with metallopeptidase domain
MTQVLVSSSVLILALAGLRPLLRGRIRPRVQYALWLLVALRLLLPVTLPASPASVLNLVRVPAAQAALQAEPGAAAAVPAAAVPAASGAADNDAQAPAAGTLNAASLPESLSAKEILTLVWLGGAALAAAAMLAENLRFSRRLRRTRKKLAVDCPVPVYLAEGLPSACLAGLVHPAIYLTPESCRTEESLRHILAHELAHRRHGDLFWALVRDLCLCLYWFDPLVYLAALLSRRDCELCCDEAAIGALGEDERLAYGRTLLSLACPRPRLGELALGATTMSGGKRGLRERISLIAKKPRMLAVTLAAVLLVTAGIVLCTFTGAAEKAPAAASASQPEQASDWQTGSVYSFDTDALRGGRRSARPPRRRSTRASPCWTGPRRTRISRKIPTPWPAAGRTFCWATRAEAAKAPPSARRPEIPCWPSTRKTAL